MGGVDIHIMAQGLYVSEINKKYKKCCVLNTVMEDETEGYLKMAVRK